MPLDENKPVDRRRFFRLGLAELLRPLSAAAKPLTRVAHELGKLDQIGQPLPRKIPLGVWLRPPGSLPENQFRESCTACGECVRVCPAHAIKIDPNRKNGDGAAYIDPNDMTCVVCEGLKCMHVCPTGSILPVSINDIDMGTAVWHEESCLRTHGENCTICVDHCPLGTAAIELRHGQIAVNPLGCIGCGVCQHDCPTAPKSITVIPIAAKTRPI